MNIRPFGKTGINTTEVGLGCWQFGGDWGEIGESQVMNILETAIVEGIRFFDTADIYGGGISEKYIGKFMSNYDSRDEIFVATKLGRDGGLYPDKYSKDAVRHRIEESLKRLKTVQLDLIQLHCIPTEVIRGGEIFDWLREFQEEGIIRNFGASVESMEEAQLCLKQQGLASLQIIFNVFRQKPIDVLFDDAKSKGTAIIVRLPLASGLLTGKFTKETVFESQDHRHFNKNGEQFNVGETFSGLPFEYGVDLAEQLRFYLPASMTMAQFALRWILDYEAVSVVIPGATREGHVRANAKSSELPPLSPELHLRLRKFYDRMVKEHIRGPY